MLNKYTAALLATIVYGLVVPLGYQVLAQDSLRPMAVAMSAAAFFFIMVAVFGKLLPKPALQQT
jgi:predicted TIM-barrel enzyme